MSQLRDWILRWIFHQPSVEQSKDDATGRELEADRIKKRNEDAVSRAKVLQQQVDAELASIRRGRRAT